MCSFCLDTKRTKKVKSIKNWLKLTSFRYQKITRGALAQLKQIFWFTLHSVNFFTPIFKRTLYGRNIFWRGFTMLEVARINFGLQVLQFFVILDF
jgi:hypothetical protein